MPFVSVQFSRHDVRYAVESKSADEILKLEQRMALRNEKSYLVIRTFEKWMQAYYPKVPVQSRMGRAMDYIYAL